MDKHAVPDIGSKLQVSTAVPDILYSYNFGGEFHQQLLYEQLRWYSTGPELRSLLESWSITKPKASVSSRISGLRGPMLMHPSGLA
jgi:hypothetical protein